MKYIYHCILILACAANLNGQKIYTAKDILGQSVSSQSSEIYNTLQEAQRKSSVIEKNEFRTETDRWDSERQEYTFRTSCKST